MSIHLIRHGHAGKRAGWSGDDIDRPLSAKGHHQADHLTDVLSDHEVGRIYSSPAQRCVETVEPLATRLGLEVHTDLCLAEGAEPRAALRWLLERAEENPAACSHGDLIPVMIRLLLADGLEAEAGSTSQKGSLWVLETDAGHVRRGTYHPPVAQS